MGKGYIIGFGITLTLGLVYLVSGVMAGSLGYFLIATPFLVISVLLVKLSRKKKSNPALDILNERYAKGEITKEEFEQMKDNLE